MSTATKSSSAVDEAISLDGFDMLDACHCQTLMALGQLKGLLARLGTFGADAQARQLAAAVLEFFGSASRAHHEDEERHVFPGLLAGGDPDIAQAVQRLQLDHLWLDADWQELSPAIDAIACGQSWFDIDILREGAEIFVALSLDHMTLEESYIYPQARSRLGAPGRREMGREMSARRRAQGQPSTPPH